MRFTLRDLLWLTVVVGLSLGWFLHYQRLTRPPQLYRDEEILPLRTYSRYVVDDTFDPPRLLVAEGGKAMPLSQVFKTLSIDPRRLADFRHQRHSVGMSLWWQLSPSYDLTCDAAVEDDGALAFDDPNRKIYGVWIHSRNGQ